MASISMHFTLTIVSFFLITIQFPSPSIASSQHAICNTTPHPSFCRSQSPNNYNNSTTVCGYGRFLIRRSVETTQNFIGLVNAYLGNPYALNQTDILALEDCHSLLNLNLAFLSTAIQNTDSTDYLQSTQAEDMHTLLSAVLTNHETCSDGIQWSASPSIQDALLGPFKNVTMLYSVSLALYKQGWVTGTSKGRWLTERRNPILSALGLGRKAGHPHLKIPRREEKVTYEVTRGRKLLQTGGGYVHVNKMATVRQDGTGDFNTIGDAVAAAPNNTDAGGGYYLIFVAAGVYQEYVSIASCQTYIMMIGDGIGQTIITGSRNTVDGWTTFNSATFAVVGTGFVGVGLTIQNTAGPAKYQAVALRNGADLSAFYNCSFEGYQDTLYTHSLRQFYRECDIYGTIDFIFGNAAVVFQNCNIYLRLPIHGQENTITAQGRTDVNQNTGTSIQNCRITAAPELGSFEGTVQSFLGRPWKQYSRTIYMYSFVDGLVNPAGWLAWTGNFALDSLFYGECGNYGAGSVTTFRVTWPGYRLIGSTDALNFTVSNFVSGDGWLPMTGVPYAGGLM